ncbi:megakaryocyte and platelet inhibitory receptor G6b isoform X2 [Balaenoptera musculus]|uniref:Megakaryocyte and platelet inhibitory receptor G6b isoform X2 n=1 Tax=Balaenoptera musculus TaxID=9771 RepID=A0A8B8YWP5_BALMU|nr:megakaryocyte and platelet inhibitory receptor G6b isoform X2 [Balaenoptera musculus]
MALVLQLLPLLLWRAQGNPGASLDGHPGDRVNLSCVGVSQPTRWVWAPRFPACKGLSKGRRAILLASPSGTPTVSPVQPFAGRLRALDLDIRRLELLLSAGDSGTFICKGRQENESRTELHVLGDRAYCRAPGPTHGRSRPSHKGDLTQTHAPVREGSLVWGFLSGRASSLSPHPDLGIHRYPASNVPAGSVYPQILIPLLGAGLVLGLGVLGWACWLRRRSPLHPPRPPPRFALSPPHSSTRESGAPEARRGGRAQDCRGPGPGAEPALRRPGSYGPQKILPTVPSGPC